MSYEQDTLKNLCAPDASNQNDSSTTSVLLKLHTTNKTINCIRTALSYPKNKNFFFLFDPDVVLQDVARSSDRNSHAQKKEEREIKRLFLLRLRLSLALTAFSLPFSFFLSRLPKKALSTADYYHRRGEQEEGDGRKLSRVLRFQQRRKERVKEREESGGEGEGKKRKEAVHTRPRNFGFLLPPRKKIEERAYLRLLPSKYRMYANFFEK